MSLRQGCLSCWLSLPWELSFHGVVDLDLTSELISQQIKFSVVDDHIGDRSYLLVFEINVFNGVVGVDGRLINLVDGKLVHKIPVLWEGLQRRLVNLHVAVAGVVLPQEDEPRSDDLTANNKLTAELSLEMLVVCRVAGAEYDDLKVSSEAG